MTLEQAGFPIDDQQLVAFTQALIRCQSWNPPGDETGVAALVAQQLEGFGLEVEIDPLGPSRHNVTGRLRGGGAGQGGLLLAGHLDTVPPGDGPWSHDPLGGRLEDGRIYGRGAADMKGGLAAMVFAAGALARSGLELPGNLLVAGTVGEEVDCRGAQALLEKGWLEGVGAIAIPEPTGVELCIAHKGALWLRVETQGRAAHGARPDLGVNAILRMADVIRDMVAVEWDAPPHPLLGRPTLNVATILGGTKTNMVPDRCELTVDIRTLPQQSHGSVLAQLEGILRNLGSADGEAPAVLEVLNDRAGLSTPADHPFVETAQKVGRALWGRRMMVRGAPYYTDGSVLGPGTGLPVILLGPGEVGQAHQTDEWVSTEALSQAARFYAALAAHWLTD